MNRPLLITALILFAAPISLTGCQPHRPPSEVALLTTNGFLKNWESPLNLRKDRIKQVYLRGNVLVAYSESNHGYFLDATSGAILGFDRIAATGYELVAPVETASFIAIPTSSTIELFNKAGRRVNSFNTPFAIQSPGTAIGDTLFLGISRGTDARVARFDLTADQLKASWELYTTDRLQSAPASLNDAVYAAGSDGKVWAVSTARTPLWGTPGNIFRTDGGITADLVIDDSGLYVPSQDKKLYALDRSTGRIKWSYYAGLPLLEGPIIFGNNIYQQVPRRGLAALDKTEGAFAREPLWVNAQSEQILSADEKYLYVRSGNSILALDRATGVTAFQGTRKDLIAFATNTQSPIIYATTSYGSMIAIRPVIKPGVTGELIFEPAEPTSSSRSNPSPHLDSDN